MKYLGEILSDNTVTIKVDELTMKDGVMKATGKLLYSEVEKIVSWADMEKKLLIIVNWLRENDGY